MSGFDSVFHEQPVNMIGMGVGPVSLPGMNMPYGYLGRDARPCGGISGYDAAANEGRRLQDAAWNSVPTYNIHEPYKLPDTSASLPDLSRHELPSFRNLVAEIIRKDQESSMRIAKSTMEYQESRRRYDVGSMFKAVATLADANRAVADIIAAQIQRQRGSLTVYEQTGDSHISHVAGKGYHVTTQVPRIGRDEGLDQSLAFHDYVMADRNGLLKFDSDY